MENLKKFLIQRIEENLRNDEYVFNGEINYITEKNLVKLIENFQFEKNIELYLVISQNLIDYENNQSLPKSLDYFFSYVDARSYFFKKVKQFNLIIDEHNRDIAVGDYLYLSINEIKHEETILGVY